MVVFFSFSEIDVVLSLVLVAATVGDVFCFTAVANIVEIGDLLVATLATVWEITQFRVFGQQSL